MELAGKGALVTGGSRGIGRAVALALARERVNVAINYSSNREKAEEVVELAKAEGVAALAVKADVSQSAEVNEMVQRVASTLGNIDILVNNAGILVSKTMLETTEELWDKIFGVNLKGVFNCCKAALPDMVARRSGKIVNMSSISGMRGTGPPTYATSKAGIMGLTMSLALELAKYGICVNAVAPGLTDTEMNASDPVGFVKTIKETVPLQRMGQPGEIAEAVLFLLRNDYVTGEVVNISGGRFMCI